MRDLEAWLGVPTTEKVRFVLLVSMWAYTMVCLVAKLKMYGSFWLVFTLVFSVALMRDNTKVAKLGQTLSETSGTTKNKKNT